MKIEICVDSPEAAIQAQKHGANRVELCANLLEGGTTPSAGCIFETRQSIDIGLFVIIRPRGGDFYYNLSEIAQMKYNIEMCKSLGVDGVVIGLLDVDGQIDIENTKALIELARPMEVTFHRAFDRCKEPLKALEQLIELGVDRILTSGQYMTAFEGKKLIGELVKQAKDRIIIMPGSGVNPQNIKTLREETQAIEFHFTAHKLSHKKGVFQHPNFPSSQYQEKVFDKKKLLGCQDELLKN